MRGRDATRQAAVANSTDVKKPVKSGKSRSRKRKGRQVCAASPQKSDGLYSRHGLSPRSRREGRARLGFRGLSGLREQMNDLLERDLREALVKVLGDMRRCEAKWHFKRKRAEMCMRPRMGVEDRFLVPACILDERMKGKSQECLGECCEPDRYRWSARGRDV